MNTNKESASIITLAWPTTRVRRIGVWYDQVTRWLGFIKRDYYKAGHAAAVLVDHCSGSLTYFDFGRYHTPEKTGRLRSVNTDPELNIPLKAQIGETGDIENIAQILSLISAHPATHGDGVMFAAISGGIDKAKALDFTSALQGRGLVHYGPFDLRGTNCSRFVRDFVKSTTTHTKLKLKLTFPWMITPSTKWNILNTNVEGVYYEINDSVVTRMASPFTIKRVVLPNFEEGQFVGNPVIAMDGSPDIGANGDG